VNTKLQVEYVSTAFRVAVSRTRVQTKQFFGNTIPTVRDFRKCLRQQISIVCLVSYIVLLLSINPSVVSGPLYFFRLAEIQTEAAVGRYTSRAAVLTT
jgi:hypothetical protein